MIHNLTRRVRHALCISSNCEDHSLEMNRQGRPNSDRLMIVAQRAVLTAPMLLAAACSQLDPYVAQFPQVSLGDSRARVLELMGQPDSINSVEVLLLKAEQLAWRAPGKGRVCLTLMVMDHVAAKFTVD